MDAMLLTTTWFLLLCTKFWRHRCSRKVMPVSSCIVGLQDRAKKPVGFLRAKAATTFSAS